VIDGLRIPEHSAVRFGRTAIPYQIVRGRRQKTVAIAIDPMDGVLLRAPAATPVEKLDEIVHGKAIWILERLRKLRDLPPPLSPRRFVSGETFLYLGRQYRLRVETPAKPAAEASLRSGWLVTDVPAGTSEETRPGLVRKRLVTWYRRHAAERVPERVAWWSERGKDGGIDILAWGDPTPAADSTLIGGVPPWEALASLPALAFPT
jgi:predicted metal-dependent hydrolase